MKNLAAILIVCLAIFQFSVSSCKKGGRCEEAMDVRQSEIVVSFKDAGTGKFLYTPDDALYNKDSLKVVDASGENLAILSARKQIDNTVNTYWVVGFGNIYNETTDFGSFNNEICKEYVVKYSFNEMDTLKVCFKSVRTTCGSVFEKLTVYNKENQLTAVTNQTFAEVTVVKK